MRVSPARIVVIVLCVGLLAALASGLLGLSSPGPSGPGETKFAMAKSGSVTYLDARGEFAFNVTWDLSKTRRVVGPFDEVVSCSDVRVQPDPSYFRRMCIDPANGGPVTFEVVRSGTSSFGHTLQYMRGGVFPWTDALFPFLLNGRPVSPSGVIEISDVASGFRVRVPEGANGSTVEIVETKYDLNEDHAYGKEPQWRLYQLRHTYVLDSGFGSFPNEVITHDGEKSFPFYTLSAREESEARAPLVPRKHPASCRDCVWATGRDLAPPASGLSIPLSRAVELLGGDSAASGFMARRDVKVIKAEYTEEHPPRSEIQRMLEDLVKPRDLPKQWEIVLADPATGDRLRGIVRQDANGTTVRSEPMEKGSYQLTRSLWPAKLVDLSTALDRVKHLDPGARLERATFNPIVDPEYFGKGPFFVLVDNKDTMEGLDASLLHWELIFDFSDGRVGTFHYSPVNGQWSLTPPPYHDLKGV